MNKTSHFRYRFFFIFVVFSRIFFFCGNLVLFFLLFLFIYLFYWLHYFAHLIIIVARCSLFINISSLILLFFVVFAYVVIYCDCCVCVFLVLFLDNLCCFVCINNGLKVLSFSHNVHISCIKFLSFLLFFS